MLYPDPDDLWRAEPFERVYGFCCRCGSDENVQEGKITRDDPIGLKEYCAECLVTMNAATKD